MDSNGIDYSSWSSEKLISRVTALEEQLRKANEGYRSPSASTSSSARSQSKSSQAARYLNPRKYSTRLIALKVAYLGQRYNGFEYHANNKTPLPTIEEKLWKALMKARLIFPTDPLITEGELSWEGCDYSKCGRTDKGVSSFGQVIGIRVRSNRPVVEDISDALSGNEDGATREEFETAPPAEVDDFTSLALNAASMDEPPSFRPIEDEVPYARILNRLLPPDIRILAWCPAPPVDFSARFLCKERRYRYFFTHPAFNPTLGADAIFPASVDASGSKLGRREGWLDIQAMQAAAKRFEGLHDFRNFCKVDPSKQIDNFQRRIFHAEIREVDPSSEPAAYISSPDFYEYSPSPPSNGHLNAEAPNRNTLTPKLYMFVLHGSAFLWHQVRHMIAVLFLVGQGLESPEIVSRLLDIAETPQRPLYEMAEDAPLVLWDCIFPREGSNSREDALEWIYVGDQPSSDRPKPVKGNGKFGLGGVVDDVWKIWRQRKMDEVLAGMLLNVVVKQGKDGGVARTGVTEQGKEIVRTGSGKVYYGGDSARLRGRYVPLMERPRMESVEDVNSKYAARKGFRQEKEPRDTGWRQVKMLSNDSVHEAPTE
ncbi:hypothetical protein MMC13_002364 [Lambiella insularis]|nr:hypothetical protein [Lambiella insularis]